MLEQIKEDFLREVSLAAQRMCLESLAKMEEEFTQELPSIEKSLEELFLRRMDQFETFKNQKLVGELSYIYISFLRTSIVSNNENYRIDFYDENNRLSLVECSAKWNFDFVFGHYREVKTTLEETFKNQTKVPAYQLDDILYDVAIRYRKYAEEKIPVIFKFLLEEIGTEIFRDQSIKFYQGEFMDKIAFLLQWENGAIHINEKGES